MAEEPVTEKLPNVVDHGNRAGPILRNRGREFETTASGTARRYSLADFTELRRRDLPSTGHQQLSGGLKGLVISTPSAASNDGAKPPSSSSGCFLPTIAGTKPQSKLLLTSTTQERRGSNSYQSILSALPFITSTRPNNASVANRRSSVCGYLLPQHSAASGQPRPTATTGCSAACDSSTATNSTESKYIGAGEQSANPLPQPNSRRPLARIDSAGSPDAAPTLPTISRRCQDEVQSTSSSLPSADVGSTLQENVDGDVSSSSAPGCEERSPAQQTSKLNADESRELQPSCTSETADKVAALHETRCCPADASEDGMDTTTDRWNLSTSTFAVSTGKELAENDCHPETLECPETVLPTSPDNCRTDDCREATVDGGQVSDVETRTLESLNKITEDGRQRPRTTMQVVTQVVADPHAMTSSSSRRPTDDGLTIVTINKGNLGLGFCIGGGRGSTSGDNPITVKRIFKGEVSLQSLLQAGDEIVAVNGIDVGGMSQREAWTTLKSLPDGPIQLSVRRK